MLKKILYYFLLLILWLLFITAFIGASFYSSVLSNSFAAYLIFLVPGMLLYCCLAGVFPRAWKTRRKVAIHFGIYSFVLLGMWSLSEWRNYALKEKQFCYRVGNGLGPIEILVKNEALQFVLKRVLDVLPYSTQYIIYTAEDASRVFKLKIKISDPKWVERTCPKSSKYECLKNIYNQIQKDAPLTVSGNILVVAVAATTIHKVKDENLEGNKDKASFEATLKIIEFSKLVLDSSKKYSKLENILLISNKEMGQLSPQLKEKIVSSLKSPSPIDMIFSLKKDPAFEKMDERMIEGYLLKNVEEELTQKFEKNLTEKIKSIKGSSLARLDAKEKPMNLSKIEIIEYKKRFNGI